MTRGSSKKRGGDGRLRPPARASRQHPSVVVLLSGGIDSASVIAAYRVAKHPIQAVFVDYGQAARRSELTAARSVADHYGVDLKEVKLGARILAEGGQFFGRNALLLLLGSALVENRPLIVGMGIHAESAYYDTTAAFVADIQRVLDGYADGAITLGAPFINMPKQAVVSFARRSHVPLAMTYSCEVKNAPACGECPSCSVRRACDVD